jgi:hypothetical protein
MIRDLASWLRRHAWILAAAAAVLLLLVLALHSPDRQKTLAEYQAAGPMRHIATADIVALRIVAGGRQWRFERGAAGWRAVDGGVLSDAATTRALETGLRLLHNTPPERGFDTASAAFGLDPPALRVSLVTAAGADAVFEAEFGGANPMGLARYVRIREGGQSALHLMPAYVAEPWEQVTGKLQP